MKTAVAGNGPCSVQLSGAAQRSRRRTESGVIESGFEAERIATPAKEVGEAER